MSEIGIFLPEIDGIGGVERVAYILAREMNVKIYTAYARKDLDRHFPGISSYILNISKKINRPSIFSIISNFKSLQDSVDLMIYRYPRSIYLTAIRKDIPYLYYLGGIPHHFYLGSQEYNQYLGKLTFKHHLDKVIWKEFNKKLDNQRVIANSKMTAALYQNIVGKAPQAILYPPIDTSQYKCKPSKDYYLSVTRFEAYKRINWLIEAFKGTNEKLIVIGNGPLFNEYFNYIRKQRIDNITLLKAPSSDTLIDYYSKCKAFVFTSYKEHFGATPLEAMASGKPVLSVPEGGPLEYVNEGANGFYFKNVPELRQKISSLTAGELAAMRDDCINTAKRYDTAVFLKKFKNLLREYSS